MVYKFSHSSLSILKDCPRCFWLSFNGIKRPEGIFPSLPNGMDKVLKAHFDSFMKQGLLPPELKELKGAKLFNDTSLLEIWRNNFKGIQWKDEEGNILRGAVDDILVNGKKLIVLDFKTRGFPLKEDTHDHYQDQLDIYNFLLRKNGYSTEEYAYLLFYHPDKVLADGSVLFNTDLKKIPIDVSNAEKIFKKALKVLNGEMPDCSAECKWCGWQSVKVHGVVRVSK